MNSHIFHLGFCQGLVAVTLAVAFSPAFAEGEDVAQLIKPSSSVSVGLGAASGGKEDRAFFGQYNGMRKSSGQLLLDVELNKRDEATGTWTNFDARNLGSENREMRFGQQKQGDWKYYFEYGELVRNYSNTINTNITGINSNNLIVNTLGNPTATPTAAGLAAAQGTGSNVDLKTTRKGLGLGADKWITPNIQFEASFKNEDKTGARLFGQSVPCSNGRYGCTGTRGYMLLLPEPINASTRQFEMKLNYADEKVVTERRLLRLVLRQQVRGAEYRHRHPEQHVESGRIEVRCRRYRRFDNAHAATNRTATRQSVAPVVSYWNLCDYAKYSSNVQVRLHAFYAEGRL
jgi:hypothetical protein